MLGYNLIEWCIANFASLEISKISSNSSQSDQLSDSEITEFFKKINVSFCPEAQDRIHRSVSLLNKQDRIKSLELFAKLFRSMNFGYEISDLIDYVATYSLDEKKELAEILEDVFGNKVDGYSLKHFLKELSSIPFGEKKHFVSIAKPLLDLTFWVEKADIIRLLQKLPPKEQAGFVKSCLPLIEKMGYKRRDLDSSEKISLLEALSSLPDLERTSMINFIQIAVPKIRVNVKFLQYLSQIPVTEREILMKNVLMCNKLRLDV